MDRESDRGRVKGTGRAKRKRKMEGKEDEAVRESGGEMEKEIIKLW